MNFLNYKIIGAPKKFKNQLRPLDRLGSVNFCQNFWNLFHETDPLKTTTEFIFALLHLIPPLEDANARNSHAERENWTIKLIGRWLTEGKQQSGAGWQAAGEAAGPQADPSANTIYIIMSHRCLSPSSSQCSSCPYTYTSFWREIVSKSSLG